jgi:thioredoxin 1
MHLPSPAVFIRRAVIAAAACAAVAVCSSSQKQDAAAETLPLLTTAADLDTAIAKAGDRLLVLEFYADWCRPCKLLAPTINALAEEFKGKAFFYGINIDRSADLAGSFGARGIPYIVFLKNGKAVYAFTGVYPEAFYEKALKICARASSADDCRKRLDEER